MARIISSELFRIVPTAAEKVPGGAAVKIIRNRYCSKIHTAGFCDQQCERTCGETLLAIFGRVNEAPDMHSYPGLLTWMCRVKSADLIEEIVEASKTAPTANTDGWGVPVQGEDQQPTSLKELLHERSTEKS